ncbi:BTAD domain-containing putative transcriptional regulator [Saccharothrix isguenensis]
MSESGRFPLRVQVLGPVRAWSGEHELPLGSNRRQAVLAVLAAQPGRPVPRRALIAGVWGGEVPPSATGNLHTYLSGLRRALGPARDLLVSDAHGYSLRLDRESLDSAVFDRCRREARQRHAAGDLRGAVALLDEGLALWAGEAYAGVRGPFAEQARRRLEGERLEAVVLRARTRLELGEHAGLVPELTDLVRRHPLDESLHELLMRALHRGGRHAEALEAFRTARSALAAEGVEPGRDLRDLHQLMLAGPSQRDVEVLRVGPPRVTTGALSGRAAELAALTGALDGVLDGRGRAVWVEGESGIGKSALLTAALVRPDDRPHHLAWAVADEMGDRFPLAAVLDALDVTPRSRDRRRAELAARLRAPAARQGWNRTAPVDELLGYVAELCATAPLVLVVDDLHRVDDAGLLFWDRLVSATGHLPLLLVGATRPTGSRDRLARPRRGVENGNGLLLRLGPLPQGDVEHLVGAMVGATRGPALRSLASSAAGNPRYAVEVTGMVWRDGGLRVVDGEARLDDGGALDRLRDGTTVLDDLSQDAREVLRSAALLGARFAVTDLATVTGRSPVHLLRVLDEAVAAGLVVVSEDHLAFRHPFVRWAVYRRVPQSLRTALHREAAEALAGARAPVERIVEHLESATVDAWVAGWLVAHREEAVERAPLPTIDLLRRLLATGLVDGADRTALAMVLLRALFRLGHDLRAEAADALAGVIGPDDAAEARHLLARTRHRQGDTAGAVAVLEAAVRVPGTSAIWRIRHHALIADLHRGTLADPADLDACAERAHGRSTAAGDTCAAAYALQNRWFAASVRRDHESALHRVDEALALVDDDPALAPARCDLLDNRAFTLQNLDRLDDAALTLRRARQVIADHGLPAGMAIPSAVLRYWSGDWEGALVEMSGVNSDSPGTAFYGIRESGPGRVLLHGLSALISIRRDEWDNARVHLDAVESPTALTGSERDSADFLLVATALAAERRGAPDEAVRLLTPLLRPCEAPMVLRHQWLPLVVRLALETGDDDVARRAVEVAEGEAAAEVTPARAAAASAHCRALVTGDAEAIAAVADHHGSVGRVVERLAALEDLAATDHDRSAEASAEVEAGYRRLGARWDLRRVRRRPGSGA